MKEDKGARWFELECVPKEYIFPKEHRPQNLDSPVCDSIPVISLAKSKAENGHSQPVEEILKASQELGFFQFLMWLSNFYRNDSALADATTETVPHKKGYFYTYSTDFAKDGVHLWRENFKHPCHPLEECIHLWPDTPTRYQ
ncbi:putative isopenicillin N synthase [Helianthus debilis subsp. tardiflorus]